MDQITQDYFRAKRVAVSWARIAIDAKRAGMPWHQAASNSHAALAWALFIIA